MPNIGSNLAEKLTLAGISTPADLMQTGAENAFIRLKTIDKSTCINCLYALEGAIQNVRWHSLTMDRKNELKSFFNSLTL